MNLINAVNPIKSGLILLELQKYFLSRFLNLKQELSAAIVATKSLLTNFIKAINRDSLRLQIFE